MDSKFTTTIAAALLASSLGLPAVAIAASGTAPSIIAMGQKVKNGSVSIEYAYVPSDGFLVIHPSEKNGTMSSVVIGQTALAPGGHDHVPVKLSSGVKSGQKLWAELQQKPFAAGKSKPFKSDGTPVEESFLIR